MTDPMTRRGFLTRTTALALAGFGVVAGATRAAAAGPHGEPPPCRVRCEPISKTGCVCGGSLYRCSGCGSTFHACIPTDRFGWFCLRRSC